MSGVALQFDQVSKRFGEKAALDAVSFDVRQGEIFGLIGLNGAGKTTLIKVLLDLVRADDGMVKVFGEPSANVQARQQLVYLPEKLQPSPNLKGCEYLQLALRSYGQKISDEQMAQAAKDFTLEEAALTQLVRRYSKGMGQKLGLMSSFLSDVPLMVLDEPMSGLDPQARGAVKQVMKKAKSEGKTIFFSSHILADIQEICERLAIIHEGKLVFTGTVTSFMEQHHDKTLEAVFLERLQAAA